LPELAIAAGFLRRDAELAIDSTPIHGAAVLQDTCTLLRSGLRKLLLAMGESDPERRRLAKRLKLSDYLVKRKPELDWDDPRARKAHLQELVADAERLSAEAQGALILLEQLLGQDITRQENGQLAMRQGVAAERVISTMDPEMRHGRKSFSTRFDGYKGHLAADPESELVTEVTVTPANTYEGQVVEGLLGGERSHPDLQPGAVVGDQSVIDAGRRHLLAERGIEAVGKVTPRRAQCTTATRPRRTVSLHPHEALL